MRDHAEKTRVQLMVCLSWLTLRVLISVDLLLNALKEVIEGIRFEV